MRKIQEKALDVAEAGAPSDAKISKLSNAEVSEPAEPNCHASCPEQGVRHQCWADLMATETQSLLQPRLIIPGCRHARLIVVWH